MSVNNIIANKRKKKKKSEAYIKHHYKVLKVQYEYLDRILCWCNKDSFKLVAHIISCQLYNYKEENEGYVPIPFSVRKLFCREAEVDDLVEKGVVERLVIDEEGRTYSVEFNICTNYRVKEDIIEGFMKLEDMTATEYMKAAKVNLFDGKRCRAINKSKVVDYNNNKYPNIIVSAIKCINSCTFELAPVERHIGSLKHNMLGAEAVYGKDSAEYKKARGRYYNDNACLKNALNQNAEEILPGFYSFIPNYTVSDPGRIHTFMQNASREMKEAAFSNVDNLKNYDLRSSQAIGLIQQFEIAGLDTTWLENYKDDKQAKYNYARKVGISVDTWKKCLCALLMGGYVPKKYKDESKADILGYLLEEAQGDIIKATEYLSKFSEEIKPLKVELDKWHEWLITTYVNKIGTYAAGKLYLSNPTGRKLCIDNLPRGRHIWKRKAKLAAFVLHRVRKQPLFTI